VLKRGRFADIIRRQLDLAAQENAELMTSCQAALRAYDQADREDAGEYYERFGDLQEELMDALEGIRDGYAATLDDATGEGYAAEFDRAAAKRFQGLWVK
jgi:hypothetical protein